MRFRAYIVLPVAWIEDIEAESWEEAEDIAKRLMRDENWLDGLDIKVNDEPSNLVHEDDVQLECVEAVRD